MKKCMFHVNYMSSTYSHTFKRHTWFVQSFCMTWIASNDIRGAAPSGSPQERAHPPLGPPPTGWQGFPRPLTHSSLQEGKQASWKFCRNLQKPLWILLAFILPLACEKHVWLPVPSLKGYIRVHAIKLIYLDGVVLWVRCICPHCT